MMNLTNTAPKLTWTYLLQQTRPHKRILIFANIIALLAAMASVPIPLLMPLLVDEVLLNKPGMLVDFMNATFPASWQGPILYILFIMFTTMFLRLLSLVFAVIQTREFTFIAKDISFGIRKHLLQRLQTVSMTEYETLGSGTVASHLVTDVEAIDSFIGSALSKFIVATLSIIGVAAILLWIHWQLALFILVMNPAVIYLTMVMGKKVKRLKSRENTAFQIFQQSLAETLDAIQQIRASNRERHYLQRVIDSARGIKHNSANFSWKSDAASRFSFFIFLIGFEMFRGVSMLMVVFSDLSIGQMFAVYAYLWFMMAPMQEILGIQYNFYAASAAMTRLNNLLQLQQEAVYPHKANPFENNDSISLHLENIHFAYSNGEKILNHLNLQIKTGEKVALVGASGGGKSTLVQLIIGLYPPSQGQIYFNDIAITDIGLDVVRDNVAIVLQQPALFNDSIRHNLDMGQQLDDHQLWQALEIAQLHDTIKSMPEQLDTLVGRNGVRLSGGQRQRLAIARMILSNPKMVILDEATSALDAETEFRLHQALAGFLKNKTTLIIAHRLSAVKQADRAYVFDNGCIIDEGHHDELLTRDGLYQQLYGQRQS